MARRKQSRLDEWLDAWAIWCDQGGMVSGGGSSMIGKMMDNAGLIQFGSGGGSMPLIDTVEGRIEQAVTELAIEDQAIADVLRLEYCAMKASTLRERGFKVTRHFADMTQLDKANLLNMSVRTYRRKLAYARDFIQQALTEK